VDLIPATAAPRVPVVDRAGRVRGEFPVHRIYCVGRNFAEHAREMGAAAPSTKAERGVPTFFMKPADAIVIDGVVPYPRATQLLHHEVELVVALGRDAPAGGIAAEDASALIFGYGVGLDLTRRDLQNAAKAKGLPWDTGKGFDHSAPLGTLLPASGCQRRASPTVVTRSHAVERGGHPARTVEALCPARRRSGVHGHAGRGRPTASRRPFPRLHRWLARIAGEHHRDALG